MENKKKKALFAARFLIGIFLLIGLALWLWDPTPDPGKGSASDHPAVAPSKADPLTLNETIRFTGSGFVIENLDPYDWTDCNLNVNGYNFSAGYGAQVSRFRSHKLLTVSATEFANADGLRFNPITMKVLSFWIRCTTPKGIAVDAGHFNSPPPN